METFTVHVIKVKILPYARIEEKTCVYLDNLVPRAVPLKKIFKGKALGTRMILRMC